MTLGPVLYDGSALIGYGDYGANTGPVDVMSITPTGEVLTHTEAMDNEQIIAMRKLSNGFVYIPAVDPKTNVDAELVTSAPDLLTPANTWVIHIDGFNPVHVFDVALDPDNGEVLVCGSRGPDNAFVWRTFDEGATWVEDLNHVADGGGFNRFYEFRYTTSGLPVVVTTHGTQECYMLEGGTWSDYGLGELELQPKVPAYDTAPHNIYPWSSTVGGDGSTWLCDGNNIYRKASSS